MKKLRLFTPGPTMIPEEVMLEMAKPMEHHRTAFYRDMAKECHELLQYLFQTKGTCLTVTGKRHVGGRGRDRRLHPAWAQGPHHRERQIRRALGEGLQGVRYRPYDRPAGVG